MDEDEYDPFDPADPAECPDCLRVHLSGCAPTERTTA